MLSVFVPTASVLKKIDSVDIESLPPEAIWIDLKTPSPGEDKAVEKLVGIEIPTREDMQEIEISSRLYIENNARYMTATLMCAKGMLAIVCFAPLIDFPNQIREIEDLHQLHPWLGRPENQIARPS